MRGEPWLAKPAKAGSPYTAITFGTLSSAVYDAHEQEPANPYVIATVNGSLHGCRLFINEMPPNVKKWLRDYHNQFTGGCGVLYIDLIILSGEIEVAWSAYRLRHGLQARAPNYQQTYWKYVNDNYEGNYKSQNSSQDIKSFYHTLKKLDLMSRLNEMTKSIDFLHKDIPDAEGLALIMKGCGDFVLKHFVNYYDNSTLAVILLVLCKFCSPHVTNSGRKSTPWVFKRMGDLQKLELLLVDLSESVLFKCKKPDALVDDDVSNCTQDSKQRNVNVVDLALRGIGSVNGLVNREPECPGRKEEIQMFMLSVIFEFTFLPSCRVVESVSKDEVFCCGNPF